MDFLKSLIIVAVVVLVLHSSIKIVPRGQVGIVERLGKYHRTLRAGHAFIIPFVDRLRALVDLREQVVSFPPQPVITSDNLVVNVDSVICFQVTEPKAATYEIASYLQAIEQLTVTTLRDVIGSMDLAQTLASRPTITAQARKVLDEATRRWGIRVLRLGLNAVEVPVSAEQPMEWRSTVLAPEAVTSAVVGIVSELTGYPPELLDLDLDVEADLGIDTVKAAEILAAVRDKFRIAPDDSPALRDLPTLNHVIRWAHGRTAIAAAPEASATGNAGGSSAEINNRRYQWRA